MELHRSVGAALQPALKPDDREHPAERQARNRDADVQEHHHVVPALAHRGDRHLLSGRLEHQASARQQEARKRLRRRPTRQDAPRGCKPDEEVREASEDSETAQEVAPEHVDLHLEDVRLRVRGHRGAGDTDAERREGVEAALVTGRFRDRLGTVLRLQCGGTAGCKPPTDALALDAHADEAGKPEHDGDTDVLNLLRRERVARLRTEALHPGVGDTVAEDDGALDELRGWVIALWCTVPGPTELREGSQVPRKRNKAIAPEDAALCRRTFSIGEVEGTWDDILMR